MYNYFLIVTFTLVSPFAFIGCGHKKDVRSVTLNELQSKRVAMVEIDAPPESKQHVEVAIINEILDEGRFQITDRTTVLDALSTYPDEADWQRLGKKIGADYVLQVKLNDFRIADRQGLDRVQEEDSLLTQESGESKPVVVTRYVKVKALDGVVSLHAKFFDVAANEITYQGRGEASERVNSRDYAQTVAEASTSKKKLMPGKMKLLERLTSMAIRDFFERIPKK